MSTINKKELWDTIKSTLTECVERSYEVRINRLDHVRELPLISKLLRIWSKIECLIDEYFGSGYPEKPWLSFKEKWGRMDITCYNTTEAESEFMWYAEDLYIDLVKLGEDAPPQQEE